MGQVHLAWPLTIQEKLLQNGGVKLFCFSNSSHGTQSVCAQ